MALLGSLWILRGELTGIELAGIREGLGAVTLRMLLAGLGLTAVHYGVLFAYDALGLRFVGVQLRPLRIAEAATLGSAFSQGLGSPLLTGATVRLRLYTSWGLTRGQVDRVVGFYRVAFWLGLAALVGALFVATPLSRVGGVALSTPAVQVLGVALLAVVVGYLALAIRRRGRLRIGPVRLLLPRPRLALAQVLLGALDGVVAAAVLWVLLPEAHGLTATAFVSVFLVAHVSGLASPAPGGIGVFEGVFLALLPDGSVNAGTVAGLLAYRLVYYVVPLFLAMAGLAIRETLERWSRIAVPLDAVGRASLQLLPLAAAATTFVLGAFLLVSGALPTPPQALRGLDLSVIEFSHFVGSIIGLGLLVVGAVVLLVRGFGLVLPALFMGGAAALYAARGQFYRRASLLDEPFTPRWTLAIVGVLLIVGWLGFFTFGFVEYNSDLWWRFAVSQDAPRFLRGGVAAAVAGGVFLTLRLLRTVPPEPEPPDDALMARVAPLVAAAPRSEAALVLLRDKQILLSESGRSFVMYQVSGSSWVVMSDPVGDETEFGGLLWALRQRADQVAGELVVYSVTPRFLSLYIDLGLSFFKLGEAARVPLVEFSLDGSDRADLRKAMRRLERDGGSFEVVRPPDVAALLPRLREISDAWLAERNAREKRFSLGFFDDRYIAGAPVAVVRVSGEIVAFANVVASDAHEDMSVDLMRYLPDAPRGMMDALFGHLMVWGAHEGYQWFNLGMAPFSGLDARAVGGAWRRAGHALFRYGEHFYNFQGLRQYKEKFQPVWEPRYLAAPLGARLPGVIADVTALISGGLRGAIMR